MSSTTGPGEVLAAGGWKNNAELIAEVARLGWLDGRVLDLSYGLGKFWTEFRPDSLVANDLNPDKGDHHHDARNPPFEWHQSFDAVVWDPPYRMHGRPDTKMGHQYGIDVARTKDDILDLIGNGTVGASKCVAAGGWLHVKCQNMINGSTYIDQARYVIDTVAALGDFEYRAPWYLMARPIPQPAGRRQLNPRNNVSQLLSFHRLRVSPEQLPL